MNSNKKKVHDFWNKLSCGEELYLSDESKTGYQNQSNSRYKLEGDLIFPFAEFNKYKDKKVLEIGVGLGSDHQKFSESGADLFGIDLTEKAINHTSKRLSLYNLKSNLSVGDAECLKFKEEVFDLVYSWGVLHHSPDTPKAISEVYRVLKKGGVAKIMIYHKWSVVGYMLWVRYALLKLKPFQTLEEIYSNLVKKVDLEAPISIHTSDWPEFKEEYINQPLIDDMNLVMKLVSLGHAARNQSGIKVRQPLQEAAFTTSNISEGDAIQEYSDLLKDELNVKNVRSLSAVSEAASYEIMPLPKQLGQKYKKEFPFLKLL